MLWWLVLLVAGIPGVARILAHAWFVHVRHVLDHRIPDDLPKTAGQWLKDKIESLGLGGQLSVVITDKEGQSLDAFHVQRGVIQLTADTSFKRDPVFWAVAAHELGHAQFRLRHPLSELGTRVGAYAKAMLTKIGVGLAAGNVLVAVPRATTIAFWCLAGALVLQAFELIDEAIASVAAVRMLKTEPALRGPHQRAVRSTLLAAFLTYAAPFVGYAVMLSQWWIVAQLTAVPRVPSGGPTMIGWVIAAIASAFILFYALSHVRLSLRASPHLLGQPWLLTLTWLATVIAMVVVGWDRHVGVGYGWCVLLACCELDRFVQATLELPSDIVTAPLMRWARRRDRGLEMSTVFRQARAAGAVDTREGNRWLESLRGGFYVGAGRRIWVLNRLLVLPLVIVFWM